MSLPDEKQKTPVDRTSQGILEARARALAQPRSREEDARPRLDVLQFLLAGERYGVALEFIREVLPLKDFSPIPCTPAFVVGMMNVRGQILTLLNLCPLLDLPKHAISNLNQVVVLRGDDIEFGVLADAILGMRSVEIAALQETLPGYSGVRAELLRGVTPDRLIILDARKVLTHPGMIVKDEGHA